MKIKLQHLKPTYMSGDEIPSSDIYLQPEVIFEQGQYYLTFEFHLWCEF